VTNGPKILIVDDIPANLVALRKLLEKMDAQIFQAGSGEEALAMVLELDFALILLDVQMPGMDGYEVAAILNGEEQTREIPIIFLTAAHKDEFNKIKGYKAGAVDYIEKPINENLLRSKVRVFLDLHQQKINLEQLLHQATVGEKRLREEIVKRQHVEDALRKSQEELEKRVTERTLELSEEIAVRKAAQEQLKLAGVVFNAASEGIIVTDKNHQIKTVNPAFCRISGYQANEVIGRQLTCFLTETSSEEFQNTIWQKVMTSGHWNGEYRGDSKNKQTVALWLSISATRSTDGSILQTVMVFTDITQRKIIEDKIHHQAHYDSLTDLPNRLLFNDRLEQAVLKANRNRKKMALLFLDLDRFKDINDALGHSAGDNLLIQAGKRIRSCVRESDTVARLGGDEFMIIIGELNEINNAVSLAEKLIVTLSEPFPLNGSDAFISSSIGITIYPDDAENAEQLFSNADMAMYKAKEEGRNTFQFFTKDMTNAAIERMRLEEELRLALKNEEFLLYYQPIVDLTSGKVVSVEALVRWNHPQRGIVSPVEFIGIAEKTGLIVDIGEWVVSTACHQLSLWQSSVFPDIKVSVNLSGRECENDQYVSKLTEILHRLGLAPQKLMLEITENIMMSEKTFAKLNALIDIGVRISVDDFGTGYSSLGYLQKFQLEAIKIDRSFIQNVLNNPKDCTFVEAIISMAHQLGLKVIVEGVETPEQERFLQSRHCAMGQGYLYSPPVPPDVVEKLFSNLH
jgi:diguanylate cyclase (GGDEF)-like protein/PAS domain S-box-containing protein